MQLQILFIVHTWKIYLKGSPSVQHKKGTPFQLPKSLSSTPKTPQFNKLLSWAYPYVELKGFWCLSKEFVELRGVWCLTEGFWVLKKCGPCVELRESVWNWLIWNINDSFFIYQTEALCLKSYCWIRA